ncbi:hypothetical protein ACJX0J_015407, partial [Zea mays]
LTIQLIHALMWHTLVSLIYLSIGQIFCVIDVICAIMLVSHASGMIVALNLLDHKLHPSPLALWIFTLDKFLIMPYHEEVDL